MVLSRVISAGLAVLVFLASSAHAADEYMLKLSDGTPVKVMSDWATSREKAGIENIFNAKFPRSIAELSNQYIYAFAAQSQVVARSNGALPKERSLPIGGFDVAMNSTDLALRAAGGGPILPFSKAFQWTGIGLGLTGMLLSMGASANSENVDRLKAEMNWYNEPDNLQIKIVEEIRKDDDRLKDPVAFQIAQLESIEKVLLAADLQDPGRPSEEVKLYPRLYFVAKTPAKGFSKNNLLIWGGFAHAKSIWMTGKTESDIYVMLAPK